MRKPRRISWIYIIRKKKSLINFSYTEFVEELSKKKYVDDKWKEGFSQESLKIIEASSIRFKTEVPKFIGSLTIFKYFK